MDVRHYDAAIARWTGIDPVTHHSMSTYMAFDGNPVYWADPSGADSEEEGIKLQDGRGNWHTISSHAGYRIYTAPDEENSTEKEEEESPDDWFLNKKTGQVAHAPEKKEGYEKELGEDWEHLAEEEEINDQSNVPIPSEGVFIFNLEASKKLMAANGFSLVALELFRDITVRNLVSIPNPKIDISVKQENIIEVWTSVTYVPKNSVGFNEKFSVLKDISIKQGYQQFQKITRSYSDNFLTRMLNKGKSIHKRGSVESAGNSLKIFIGWKDYIGPLSKYKL